jgi:hypothetical protein
MAQDQDILSIVQAVTRYLRDDHVFCELLTTCDADTSRRIEQSYKNWLYRVLQNEHEKTLERDE